MARRMIRKFLAERSEHTRLARNFLADTSSLVECVAKDLRPSLVVLSHSFVAFAQHMNGRLPLNSNAHVRFCWRMVRAHHLRVSPHTARRAEGRLEMNGRSSSGVVLSGPNINHERHASRARLTASFARQIPSEPVAGCKRDLSDGGEVRLLSRRFHESAVVLARRPA